MPTHFFNPQDFAEIKDLRLVAKTVVEGFLLGNNKSNRRGPGIEFSQYRSYQPGDDLRQLDWKMFARSDKYFIREAEAESNFTVRFILDASGSMGHKDGRLSKLQYANFLIAALSYLAIKQGDEVGLLVIQENTYLEVPANNSRAQLEKIFSLLNKVKPKGFFPSIANLPATFPKRKQKQLVVFISDSYQKESEISDILLKLGALGKDTLFFHLLGKNEVELLFENHVQFRDLETKAILEANPDNNRDTYLKNIQSWLLELENEANKKGIVYHRFDLHSPLSPALAHFLRRREGGHSPRR